MITWKSALGGAAALSLLGAACSAQEPAQGGSQSEPGMLTLSATGEVRAAPDMASVSAGVIVQESTAEQAMAAQRTLMTGVVAALRDAGIEGRDVQTSGLDLSPIYAPYDRNNNQQRRITGYRASNQVTAVVRDLTGVGGVLDALVAAGANNINGVQFGVDDSDALRDEARQNAVETLLARARLYADAADFDLGRIVQMSESGGFQPQPVARMREMAMADASTPIEAGELGLSVTVSATFEIDQ